MKDVDFCIISSFSLKPPAPISSFINCLSRSLEKKSDQFLKKKFFYLEYSSVVLLFDIKHTPSTNACNDDIRGSRSFSIDGLRI
jgi:hypothetical protein